MTEERPSKFSLIFAYAMIYIIWGSTYLGIRFSVQTIPPLLSGGLRFLAAGLLLVGFRLARGVKMPTLAGWKSAYVAGLLPFVVSYGLITSAEVVVPSSVAALLVALEPLWFCLIGWLFFGGDKPAARHYAGIFFGVVGTYFIVTAGPDTSLSLDTRYLFWIAVLFVSSLSWVGGAFISKNPNIHDDPMMSSGMQMLCGGGTLMALQYALSAFTGDYPSFDGFSTVSVFALAYLITFGSIVAYTSFLWLMRVEPVSRVATHAFVNPVIAVFLGWLLGGEHIHRNMLIATPMVVLSVILLIWEPKGKEREQS